MKLKKIFIIISLIILIGNISMASQFDYQGVPNVKSASTAPSSSGTSNVKQIIEMLHNCIYIITTIVIILCLLYFFIYRKNKQEKEENQDVIRYNDDDNNDLS